MRTIRRAAIALGLGGLGAAVLRLRGSGTPAPTQAGGWRELAGADLR